MTKAEAKMRMLAEWRTWIGHRGISKSETQSDASDFYLHIKAKYPELLAFEDSGQALVNEWLSSAGLISSQTRSGS